MPDCPVCSFDNPRSAATCANCGTDLRVDAQVTAPVHPGGEAGQNASGGGTDDAASRAAGGSSSARPPKPDAREQQYVFATDEVARVAARAVRKGADLALEPTELDVEPAASVTTTVTVHNLGEEVEHFTLEVNGPAGGFATPQPADLRMLPDKKASATIRFSPARDSAQRAGPHPFQVVARSTVNPDVVQRGSGVVVVGAYAGLHADLDPEVTRGRRPGTHRLELVNTGNTPARVSVELQDETDELVFDPSTFDETLEPGGRQEQPFSVAGPVPWFGRTKSFPFTAEVSSTGVPQPVHLQGVRRQVPRFPWWIPTVALALVGVAIALVAVLLQFLHDPSLPPVDNKSTAEAVRTLQEVGFKKVLPIQKISAETPAGLAIGTEPKAGERYPKDSPVSLFISRGPCRGDCPLIVPNVVGLPVDEARTHLQRAGLETRSLPRENDAAANIVIESNPTPNSPVGPDKVVTLTVSTGPAAASASSGAAASSAAGASDTAAASSGGGGSGGPVPPAGGPGSPATPLKVPDVVGQPEADARAAVEKAGLRVETTKKWQNGAPAGQVVDTEPKPDASAKAGDTVTLFLADPTQVSLQAPAPPNQWSAGATTVEVASADAGTAPQVFTGNEAPGDESSPPLLVTEPAPSGSLTGRFDLPQKLIAGDHLRAAVSYAPGAVTFTVQAGGNDMPAPKLGPAEDGVRTLDVDLSSAAGARDLEITVQSNSAGGSDRVTWKDLRVEGQTE